MKKVKKSPKPPKSLQAYSTASPNQTWEHFVKRKGRRRKVQKQIEVDQNGLCAYCENSFDVPDDEVDDLNKGRNKRDFTVEHFHPKSPPNPNPPPNYALQWENLLGTCSGGDQTGTRHSTDGYSCNAKKQDDNLVGVILNPLVDIPAFPRFFTYARSEANIGKMAVDTQCPTDIQIQAQNTIDRLGLNAPRLLRFRSKIIYELEDQIIRLTTQNGLTFDDALEYLAENIFVPPDPDKGEGDWPRFFTCIRWYLADKAEDQLKAINYNG